LNCQRLLQLDRKPFADNTLPELSPEFRARAEREIAALIERIHGARRQALIDSMGWPPRITDETLRLVDEIREQLQDEAMAALLLLVVIAGMDGLRSEFDLVLDTERAAAVAREIAQKRAVVLAEQMTETTIRRLDEAARRAQEEIARGRQEAIPEAEQQAKTDFEARVESSTNGERSKGAATSETTGANTEGEKAARDGAEVPPGMELVGFWRHSTHKPKGHAGAAEDPCPVCTPVLDKSEWEWELLVPDAVSGPPGHNRCDCWLAYELMPIEQANELRRRVGIQ
jgi:hypothetical protein